jgi:hypothetical protein
MNIIFTDIDGVLNPHWKKKWCKKSIHYYNMMCKEFDLKPVITSTWRINHSISELQAIFDEQGIEVKIFDYTPFIDQADRGLEIKYWLNENICENFVILDDRIHDITPHIGNVVKCRSWVGISEDEYLEVCNIFSK